LTKKSLFSFYFKKLKEALNSVNNIFEAEVSNSNSLKRRLKEEPSSSIETKLINSDEMSERISDKKIARNYSDSTEETAGDDEEDYLFDEFREWNLNHKLEAMDKYDSEFVVFLDAKSKLVFQLINYSIILKFRFKMKFHS
jgi:hypothetical protein